MQVPDRGFYYCTAENTVPSNNNPSVLQLARAVSEKVVINIKGEESNYCISPAWPGFKTEHSCHCVESVPILLLLYYICLYLVATII